MLLGAPLEVPRHGTQSRRPFRLTFGFRFRSMSWRWRAASKPRELLTLRLRHTRYEDGRVQSHVVRRDVVPKEGLEVGAHFEALLHARGPSARASGFCFGFRMEMDGRPGCAKCDIWEARCVARRWRQVASPDATAPTSHGKSCSGKQGRDMVPSRYCRERPRFGARGPTRSVMVAGPFVLSIEDSVSNMKKQQCGGCGDSRPPIPSGFRTWCLGTPAPSASATDHVSTLRAEPGPSTTRGPREEAPLSSLPHSARWHPSAKTRN